MYLAAVYVPPSGTFTGPRDLLAVLLLLAEAPLEPCDPAAGVEDLLLAGVERVAVGADVRVDNAVRGGAPGGKRVPAGTGHRGDHVVRVDGRLHVKTPGSGGRRVAAPRACRGGREPVPRGRFQCLLLQRARAGRDSRARAVRG